MLVKAFRADLLKAKGKGLWLLVCLAPVGLIAMQALNFGLRYDYLTSIFAGKLWIGLLDNLSMFVPIALVMGITIVCSLLANIEHHTSSWKQLLALPIPRSAVFGAKFAVAAVMLGLSCVLLTLGTVLLGLALRFGIEMPMADILALSFFPYLASWPFLALFLWLCMTFRNQAVPMTLGVVAAILTLFGISEWVPVSWPMLAFTGPKREWFIGAGLLVGAIILLIGMLHFSRKDVH
ncbi:permease [Paenibacillus nanensis]|uniref:Permease n=1 Tax=Paenibacillus nanensis TaxID=393251 RepID=A0A3A1VI37_9BACL|nr:ABC transporter permease [Paenibacillus nanensis]RIX60599.1 permease [Paenibacillus nanensis]